MHISNYTLIDYYYTIGKSQSRLLLRRGTSFTAINDVDVDLRNNQGEKLIVWQYFRKSWRYVMEVDVSALPKAIVRLEIRLDACGELVLVEKDTRRPLVGQYFCTLDSKEQRKFKTIQSFLDDLNCIYSNIQKTPCGGNKTEVLEYLNSIKRIINKCHFKHPSIAFTNCESCGKDVRQNYGNFLQRE